VRALCTNISELLAAFSTSPVPQMAVCQFDEDRYVQFWATAKTAISEVVSNQFLSEGSRWSVAQESSLVDAGWREPDDSSPNWHIVRCGPSAHVKVAELTVQAIVHILGYGESHANDAIMIKTFSSTVSRN
jgi:hypothetical protein